MQLEIIYIYSFFCLHDINKGQSFWCLQIDQNQNEMFIRISALASKKRLNKKKGTLYHYDFNLTPLSYFLEARAEILTKISLVFLAIWRHQKDMSKLTDLYKSRNSNIDADTFLF